MYALYFPKLKLKQPQQIQVMNHVYYQSMLCRNYDALWQLYATSIWNEFIHSKYLNRCCDLQSETNVNTFLVQRVQQRYLVHSSLHFARWHALYMAWPKDFPAPLLIKGADYEHSLLDDVAHRFACDWDILIPDPWYSQLCILWSQQFGTGITPKSARLKHQNPHNMGFYINHILIEVHRDPTPSYVCSLSGIDLWNRASLYASSQEVHFKFKLPTDADRMLIWLGNYLKSAHGYTLDDLLDFTLILYKIHSHGLAKDLSIFVHHKVNEFWFSSTWTHQVYSLGLKSVWLHCLYIWSHTFFCNEEQYLQAHLYLKNQLNQSSWSIFIDQQRRLITLLMNPKKNHNVRHRCLHKSYQLFLHSHSSRNNLIYHWVQSISALLIFLHII